MSWARNENKGALFILLGVPSSHPACNRYVGHALANRYTLCCVGKLRTSGGTRTRNPRLRRPVPYPLGHGGNCLLVRSKVVVFLESARKHAPYLLRLIHIQITGSSRHSTRNKQTSPSNMALEPLPPLKSSWHPKTAWPNG